MEIVLFLVGKRLDLHLSRLPFSDHINHVIYVHLQKRYFKGGTMCDRASEIV